MSLLSPIRRCLRGTPAGGVLVAALVAYGLQAIFSQWGAFVLVGDWVANEAVLTFFTTPTTSSRQMWLSSLIPVGEGALLLVIAAVLFRRFFGDRPARAQ